MSGQRATGGRREDGRRRRKRSLYQAFGGFQVETKGLNLNGGHLVQAFIYHYESGTRQHHKHKETKTKKRITKTSRDPHPKK